MAQDNLTGQTLGEYQLRALLGQGGMGAVYKAFQPSLQREVAIKILPSALSQQPGYIDRFTREAQTAAALEHPHIVPVFGYGTQKGISYVVMRLLTGGNLAERLHDAKVTGRNMPSLGEIAKLLRELASALDYAHSRGVIHRDIKTSNVMFDNQGNAYVVDFGIAKLLTTDQKLTGTGAAMGTPAYMAPEQWRGVDISPATDQYSLGALAYMAVTGREPFEAQTPYELLHKHMNEMPTPVVHLRSGLPPALDLVIGRAMSKDPQQRFQSCTAFAQAFESAIEGYREQQTNFFQSQLSPKRSATPLSPYTGTHPPAQSRSKSNLWLWMGIGAMVFIGIIFGILLMTNNQTVPVVEDDTQTSQGGIVLLASDTPESPTATFTITPSPTPEFLTPILSARADLIVRLGPDASYPEIMTIASGTQLDILGISENGRWYLVLLPDGREGWALSAQSFTTVQGDVSALDIALAPTDTPTFTPSATSTPTHTPTPTPTFTDTPSPTATLTDTPSPTATATPTATFTDTPSPTPTYTQTPTPTFTDTPSPTATLTDTPSPTIAPTDTPSPTATPAGWTSISANTQWQPIEAQFDGVTMVLVPVGCFMMGSEGGDSDERPVHEQCFNTPFWIDKYEVTQAQFRQLGGQKTRASAFTGDNRPVERITWFESQAFCQLRGGRLPTEAEWEYAGRGPDNLIYPWGNQFVSDYAVNEGNSGGQTANVGSRPLGVSWVGAMDMTGNVYEWVSSANESYPYNAHDGREDERAGDFTVRRVIRGGSWNYGAVTLRLPNRIRGVPADENNFVGFRCMLPYDAPIVQTPIEPLCRVMVNTTSTAILRVAPDQNTDRIGNVEPNQVIQVIQQQRNASTNALWYYVQGVTGEARFTGWIRADLVQPVTQCPPLP